MLVSPRAGRWPGETKVSAGSARWRGASIWAHGRSLPSPPPQVGFSLHRRRLAGIRFLFPGLGCLRRYLASSAKHEQSVQLVSVIHLRAWPVLPGARRSLQFRASPWLQVTVSLSGRGRRLSGSWERPAGRRFSHRCLPALLQRQGREFAQEEAAG